MRFNFILKGKTGYFMFKLRTTFDRIFVCLTLATDFGRF